MMTAKGVTTAPEDLNQALQDNLITRYRFLGAASTALFDVEVVIGLLAPDSIMYEKEEEDHVGDITSAAAVRATQGYINRLANNLKLLVSAREGALFAYNMKLRLPGLMEIAGIPSVVDQLTDNKALENLEYEWAVSVRGFAG